VRLTGAIVDVDKDRELTYYTDNETTPLPAKGAKATSTLGLYSALDMHPGIVHVAAAGVIDGELVGLGVFRARVFENVVQQSRGHANGIQAHIDQNVRHLEGVHQVWLTGKPHLPGVDLRGVDVSTLNHIHIRTRATIGKLVEDVVDSDHFSLVGLGEHRTVLPGFAAADAPAGRSLRVEGQAANGDRQVFLNAGFAGGVPAPAGKGEAAVNFGLF